MGVPICRLVGGSYAVCSARLLYLRCCSSSWSFLFLLVSLYCGWMCGSGSEILCIFYCLWCVWFFCVFVFMLYKYRVCDKCLLCTWCVHWSLICQCSPVWPLSPGCPLNVWGGHRRTVGFYAGFPVTLPPGGSFLEESRFSNWCCTFMACMRQSRRNDRSFSEKVPVLKTKSVSDIAVLMVGSNWSLFVLLCMALEVLVAAIQKVEIELADNKSSWILAIVSAGVVAPDKSIIIFVAGNIKSVSKDSILSISWSAFVTTHKVLSSHQASHEHSIAPSLKNLWNFLVGMMPSHKPLRNTKRPATTSRACWLRLGWNRKICPSLLNILLTAWNNFVAGWARSGIFITNCHRLASVWQSGKSRVNISQVEHIAICARNHSWCDRRQSALALACAFVKIW